MYDCVVPGCKAKGVHNFPRNEQLRKLWEIVAKMNESKIYSTTRTCKICSAHFKPSDYFKEGFYTGVKNKKRVLKKSVIPSRFPWNTKKKIILKKMGLWVGNKETITETETKAAPESDEKQEDGQKNEDVSATSVEQNQKNNIEKTEENVTSTPSEQEQKNMEKMDIDTTNSADSQTEVVKTENKDNDSATIPENQEKMSEKTEEPPKVPEFSQTQIIVKITPDQILEALQAEVKQDKTEMRLIKQRKKQLLSMDHFKHDNSEIFNHTGMPSYDMLLSVFQTLGPEVYFLQSRRNVISAEDQFFLTLIKLRQNKEDEKLAKLFSVTPAVAKNIFITWIDFLYEKWKMINLSPDNVGILISPLDYVSQEPESEKKGKKGKAKKKPAKKAVTVPDIIPEWISSTYIILMSSENMKHVSRAKLYLVCEVLCGFINNTINPLLFRNHV